MTDRSLLGVLGLVLAFPHAQPGPPGKDGSKKNDDA